MRPELLYSDDCIYVCVKPPGVLSESGGMPELLAQYGGGAEPPLCVHRLDKPVGGLMVYARSKDSAGKLSAAIVGGEFEKEYLAVVQGCPAESEGSFTDLLYKDSRRNKSYVVNRKRGGVREAALEYRTLETAARKEGNSLSLVRVRLLTGRFHQIRVQFASRKMPLLGDRRYGGEKSESGLALWSCRLAFPHPRSGEHMEFFKAPPDEYPWNTFNTINTDM
ncbi:MAG: RluA family pseudouridine synthase [Oscillospiraceae bacterium]|nr:RluA family pseudouridine synthase [Oscillospiraceae bacterium]